MKVLVPISGGLDSTVSLYAAVKDPNVTEVHAISFDYGQRHKKELECAAYHCKKLNVPLHNADISFFRQIAASALTRDEIDVPKTKDVLGDPQTAAYVPYRNLMMVSICASYCETNGLDTIYYGSAEVDSQAGYWDSSVEFFDALKGVLDLNRRDRVEVKTLLIDKSKKDIIQWGKELGVEFDHTWTCYNGKDVACAECPSCSSRIRGFMDAGFPDPIPYAKDIPWDYFNEEAS